MSGACQSDKPQPLGSYRIRQNFSIKRRNRGSQTGLCQSRWTCVSHVPDLTNGNPLPQVATARFTPSPDRQNLTSCTGAENPAGAALPAEEPSIAAPVPATF